MRAERLTFRPFKVIHDLLNFSLTKTAPNAEAMEKAHFALFVNHHQ